MKDLVIRGFYGNGNCGDEAILQTLVQYFGSRFNCVLSVNDLPAVLRLKEDGVYPYAQCEVCWNFDRDIIAADNTIGLFLGGGGLGLGFGWDQYMFSWHRGKKLIHSGVHVTGEYFDESDAAFNSITSTFLNSADFFSVRHRASLDMCSRMGVEARLVPDWAFGLKDEPAKLPQGNYVVLVVRNDAYPAVAVLSSTLEHITHYARDVGCRILMMPFAGADLEIMSRLKVEGMFSEEVRFKPGRALHIIKHAKAVFSVGRYHPIVFALSADTPVFSIDLIRGQRSDDKTCLQLIEEGLGDFHFVGPRINEFTPANIRRLIADFHGGVYPKRYRAYGDLLDRAAREILEILGG